MQKRDSDTSITASLGVGVLDVPQLADDGLFAFSAGLGVRGDVAGLEARLVAAEIERVPDPFGPSQTSFEISGGAIDATLHIPLGLLEPYGLIGVGVYRTDVGADENFRWALDLGGGANLQIMKSVSVGARYTYHGFWFDDSREVNVGPGPIDAAQHGAYSVMGTLTFRFNAM